jgi:hypothetical protein
MYDLAPAARSTPAGKAQPAAASEPASAIPLSYQSPKVHPAVKGESGNTDPERIKNFQMPLWLLSGGLVVQVVAAVLTNHGGLQHAIVTASLQLFVSTTLMLCGILIAAKLRQIDLGPFWIAVFKLAAISVAPAAVVALATPALNVIPLGGIVGFIGEFILYFALLGVLFDLDESDTWYCVGVMFLVNVGAYFLILWYRAKWG